MKDVTFKKQHHIITVSGREECRIQTANNISHFISADNTEAVRAGKLNENIEKDRKRICFGVFDLKIATGGHYSS